MLIYVRIGVTYVCVYASFEPSTAALYVAMTASAIAHLHARGWVSSHW